MSKRMIAGISVDQQRAPSTSRMANDSVEVFVRPLTYNSMAEATMTVWANGTVTVTVKDAAGGVVHQWTGLGMA